MSDNDVNLKPSDVVNANKITIQNGTVENTIFNIIDNNKVKDQVTVDAEHAARHAIWRSPITPYQCEWIHNRLCNIFNETICQLYHSVACNKETWYENIRQFIAFHTNIQVTINTIGLSDQEIVEVNEHGFTLFVGDNCANVDEDEFDGLNDLSIDEWATIDDIIMYYYLKDINGG
jgi:hypothetical protein